MLGVGIWSWRDNKSGMCACSAHDHQSELMSDDTDLMRV